VPPTSPPHPYIAQIRLYPIKSLDPIVVPESTISPSGGLTHDRAWALYSVDGKWVNAKRTTVIHLIRAVYSPDLCSVTLSVPNDRRSIPSRTFAFPQAHEEASEWFSVFFDQQVIVRNSPGGFPDDPIANGPTIISTATLQTVCEWFPGITLDEARLRFRTSLEIDGVSAFWEDQLFAGNPRNIIRLQIGVVNFEGSYPCARCPVPSRDPHTGTANDGFQKRFTQLRQAELPAESPREPYDHFYRLATNTRVPTTESGKPLRTGDPLILGS
jgi:uncharacterized protein YcbX